MKTPYKKWLKQKERVLDIGCGNGIITKLLIDHFSLEMIACDVNNYLIYNLPFIKIKNGKIPKFKKRFSAALLNDVLHHISKRDQEKLILQSIQIAKKVLIFEFKPTILGKLADIILNKFHYGTLNTPLTLRNIKEWQGLFKKLQLTYRVVEVKRPFWYPFSHIAFLLERK